MKLLLPLLACLIGLTDSLLADAAKPATPLPRGPGSPVGQDPVFPTPPLVDPAALKEAVQLTEMGCMSVMLVFHKDAFALEKLVAQRLSDADFRVFGPYVTGSETLPDASQARELAKDRKADLIVLTSVNSRELNKLGNFSIYEAESTVRIYSPVSNELQVIHTSRVQGMRHTNPAEAERSAREKATDLAASEAVTKSLEKSHKILVHEAQISGVKDQAHLLKILEYTAGHPGNYHVRQLTYDPKTKIAVIEIVGAPSTESGWRAWMMGIPKETIVKEHINIKVVKNEDIRKKYPAWFHKD